MVNCVDDKKNKTKFSEILENLLHFFASDLIQILDSITSKPAVDGGRDANNPSLNTRLLCRLGHFLKEKLCKQEMT